MRAGLAMFFVTLDDPELLRIGEPDRRGARDRALLQHPARRRLRDRDQPAHLDDRLPGGSEPAVPRRQARGRRDQRRRVARATPPASARAERRCATSTSSNSTREPGRLPGHWPVAKRRQRVDSDDRDRDSACIRQLWRSVARPGCQNCDERPQAAGHARARQHRRHPVGERAGAAAERGRRAARRLRARPAAPRGRLVARPPRRAAATAGDSSSPRFARLAPTTDVFHFYFGLTLIPKSLQFPLLRAAAEEERLPLPRLGHPRQDAGRARLRQARRRRDRRLVRRDPLGAGGARDPARARPAAVHAGAAVRRARARSSCTRRRTARRKERAS